MGLGVRQNPSKFLMQVYDQRTLSKKTLTKFLMENFDRANRPLDMTGQIGSNTPVFLKE
jgi:hypothetical protein